PLPGGVEDRFPHRKQLNRARPWRAGWRHGWQGTGLRHPEEWSRVELSFRDRAIASAPASAGRLLHLDDTLGGHAQLAQQVILEIRAVGLTLDGLGHATQPGITLGLTDGPAGMEHGNADGAVALLKQLGPAKPSTQKAGKLVPRHGQIFGVHSPYGPGGFPAVHDVVEV